MGGALNLALSLHFSTFFLCQEQTIVCSSTCGLFREPFFFLNFSQSLKVGGGTDSGHTLEIGKFRERGFARVEEAVVTWIQEALCPCRFCSCLWPTCDLDMHLDGQQEGHMWVHPVAHRDPHLPFTSVAYLSRVSTEVYLKATRVGCVEHLVCWVCPSSPMCEEIYCSRQALFVICMIWDFCLVTVDPLLHLSCSAFVGVNNPVASPLSLCRATWPLCSRLADLLPKTVVCCNCGRWCTCCGKVFFFQIRSIKPWVNCCVQSRLNLRWKGS